MQEAGLTTSSYGAYYTLGSFHDFEPFIQRYPLADGQDEWLQYIEPLKKNPKTNIITSLNLYRETKNKVS